MTLSKNEQIALFVVVFLVVAVAGVFVLLLPAYNDIAPNRAALAAKQAELDDLEEKYGDAAFALVGVQIVDAYERAVAASTIFHESALTDYDADRLVRELMDEAGVPDPYRLAVNRLSYPSLSLSRLPEDQTSYPLRDLARIGNVEDYASSDEDESSSSRSSASDDTPAAPPPAPGTTLDSMQRSMVGSDRARALNLYREWLESDEHSNEDAVSAIKFFLQGQNELVEAQSVMINVPLTAEEREAFVMQFYSRERATRINSMSRGDYYEGPAVGGAALPGGGRNNNTNAQAMSLDSDEANGGNGEDAPPPTTGTPRPEGGRFMYTFEVSFYIVEPIQRPSDEGFRFLRFPEAGAAQES
jgi:hypothetical protein